MLAAICFCRTLLLSTLIGAQQMQNYLIARKELIDKIVEAFVERDQSYISKNAGYNKQCKDLQTGLTSSMACSQQQLSVARWLVHYTDDWERINKQLALVRAGLSNPNQGEALEQADDGSWGSCINEWYRKLEPTVDALQSSRLDPAKLKPLKFLSNFQNTAWVMNYLWRLQISDIRQTGINLRDELSAVQTAIAQLLYKDQLHDLLTNNDLGFRFAADFEAAFGDYLAQTQHRETGYWGPWYSFDGELVVSHDLSFTFHIVNYRRGNIENWPLVIDTTLAIKNMVYPNGWRPNPETAYDLHNNYDVVQIFSYGWSEMNWDQKAMVRIEIQEMLNWCLADTIDDGAFKDNTVDGYYFGVRFLDTIGYWRDEKRFWLIGEPQGKPAPYDLCRSLNEAFQKIRDGSEEAEEVDWILRIAISQTEKSQLRKMSVEK